MTTTYERSLSFLAGVAMSMALVSCASDDTAGTAEAAPSGSSTAGIADYEAPTPSPEPTPEPTASPDGDYTTTCKYVLGDFTNYTKTGYRFIAQARVTNTGNIGTVVEVTAKWNQVGTKPVKMSKTINLEPGKTKTVNLTKQVGSEEIDLIQASAYGDECKVIAALVDTFGEPQ